MNRKNWKAFKFCMKEECANKIRFGDFFCGQHKYLESSKKNKCEICGTYGHKKIL